MDDWEQHFLQQAMSTLLRYPELSRAQQYAVAPEITRFCFDIWTANEESFEKDGRAVSPCAVPSDDLLLFVSDSDGRKVTPLHLLTRDGETRIWILSGCSTQYVGGFLNSGDVLREAVDIPDLSSSGFGFFGSLMVAILGQPRFVTTGKIATRQTRRRLESKFGITAEKLSKIVWQLGGAASEQHPGQSGRKLPLHFRRGHWRRAESHYQGAEFVRLTVPSPREGYFQWIKEQWPGHPACGVVLSVHAPKLNLAEGGHGADDN